MCFHSLNQFAISCLPPLPAPPSLSQIRTPALLGRFPVPTCTLSPYIFAFLFLLSRPTASCLTSSCPLFLLFHLRNSYSSLRAQVIISVGFSLTFRDYQSCNFYSLHNLWFISANIVLSPSHHSEDCSVFHLPHFV